MHITITYTCTFTTASSSSYRLHIHVLYGAKFLRAVNFRGFREFLLIRENIFCEIIEFIVKKNYISVISRELWGKSTEYILYPLIWKSLDYQTWRNRWLSKLEALDGRRHCHQYRWDDDPLCFHLLLHRQELH